MMYRHNTEKVVYFLLLDRKLRNPCKDDADDVKRKYETGQSNVLYIILRFFIQNKPKSNISTKILTKISFT